MSVNKIHVNSSTKISLNDRFTILQNIGVRSPSKQVRGRSRSVGRGPQNGSPPTSAQNRQFIQRLDQKHKNQPLRLKRNFKPVQGNNLQQGRVGGRVNLRRAAKSSVMPNGRLTRANSLTNLTTMKSDRMSQGPAQRLRRSNSVTSISARLGNRRLTGNNNQIQNNNPRRRLNRTVNNNNSRQNIPRSNSRARSNSRTRVVPNARSNSRNRLTRSNSQSNLKRVNSRNNLNQVNTPRRSLNKNNFRNGLTKPSVNSRLGLNRTANPIIVGNRTRRAVGNTGIRGRVVRRGAANNNGGVQVGGRVGRPRTRGGQVASARGRSQSRNRNVNQNNRNSGGPVNTPRRGRGGGARGRGAVRGGRGGSAPVQNPKSKEQLDKELEQYMSNTNTTQMEM